MNKIILGIGVPGSGKSTFLKAFAKEKSYEYIYVRMILGHK